MSKKRKKKPRRPMQVDIDTCVPNTWNPNKVDVDTRKKLTKGVMRVLESTGHLALPIVVRPHPKKRGRYEIIDGFHRWDICKAEGVELIDVHVLDVDTKQAMILTNTLNYLRGEPDAELYATYYRDLLAEENMTLEEVDLFLPDTSDEVIELLGNFDIDIDTIIIPDDEGGDEQVDSLDDVFMELKFIVARGQVEIIEAELARIGGTLQGKNRRGRALEFMAVQSAQTPMESVDGDIHHPGPADVTPHEEKSKKRSSNIKARLKRKAGRATV